MQYFTPDQIGYGKCQRHVEQYQRQCVDCTEQITESKRCTEKHNAEAKITLASKNGAALKFFAHFPLGDYIDDQDADNQADHRRAYICLLLAQHRRKNGNGNAHQDSEILPLLCALSFLFIDDQHI